MSALLRHTVGLLASVGLCLMLAGCASEKMFEYPLFEQWTHYDAMLDCAGLEGALRRTDAVRWSMREDGVRLGTGTGAGRKVLGTLGMVAGAAVGLLNPFAGASVAGSSARQVFGKGPRNTLEQADRRLVRLLQAKRRLACAPAPTALADATDLQLLDRIEELNRRREAGEISRTKEVVARSELLESLDASGAGQTK